MKRLAFVAAVALATSSAALAADPYWRSIKDSPYRPAISWTGCYIGAHIGGGWGNSEWFDLAPQVQEVIASHDMSGWLGGGQIGCDIQQGAWVFGAEAQASLAKLKGDNTDFFEPAIHQFTEVEGLGTITGRIGFASDKTLFYAKGGAAWVRDHFSVTDTGATLFDERQTRWGWTIGAGVEYIFEENWSLKVEYNFMQFGSASITGRDLLLPGSTQSYDIDQQIHTVLAGINYRF